MIGRRCRRGWFPAKQPHQPPEYAGKHVKQRDDEKHRLREKPDRSEQRGKKQNQAKPKLRVKLDAWVQVTIEVTANAITTSIVQEGNKYPNIDKFENPKGGLKGKFGFKVPGKDKLAVGGFTFTGK